MSSSTEGDEKGKLWRSGIVHPEDAQVTGCERKRSESEKESERESERDFCLVLSREEQVFVGFSVGRENY